jgi:hypothetical protein
MIVNAESARQWPWPSLRYYPSMFGETEENHVKPKLVQFLSLLKELYNYYCFTVEFLVLLKCLHFVPMVQASLPHGDTGLDKDF